jgi:hypothetical protein
MLLHSEGRRATRVGESSTDRRSWEKVRAGSQGGALEGAGRVWLG